MSDKIISDVCKKFAKEMAEVKDVFVFEEMEPYYDVSQEDGECVVNWKQNVRLRLAEYKDLHNRFQAEKEVLRQSLLHDVE